MRDIHTGKVYEGEIKELVKGQWKELTFEIPGNMDALIGEMGMCFHIEGKHMEYFDFVGFVDDLYADGAADYKVDFAREKKNTGLARCTERSASLQN